MSVALKFEIIAENENDVKKVIDKTLASQDCENFEITKAMRKRILRQTVTRDLVEELKERTGVYVDVVAPHTKVSLAQIEGPAIVLTVID